jgi:hypothetical protein
MTGTKPKWEFVNEEEGSYTERLDVPGGWLYRMVLKESEANFAVVFVPRPDHIS